QRRQTAKPIANIRAINMKKTFSFIAAIALAAGLATPSIAGNGKGNNGHGNGNPPAQQGPSGGFAIGGIGGVGLSFSGAGNLSGAAQFGNATATAGSTSYGQAESGFGVGAGTLPNGSPASGAFGNFVGANVMSGSQSTATTSATGNGFGAAGTIGAGF